MAQVLVAMSGGVDSAVAAAMLVEQGHDVTGVHLKLADVALEDQVPGHGCCTLDDAQDARRAAQVLGVPFYVWDLAELFRTEVQDPFAQAYAAGVTPNPCVTCNERVKYAGLLDRALAMGFDALATGHHARLRRHGEVVRAPGPDTRLHRAVDRRKDQSYVLYVATPGQLDRTLLPVGEVAKDEVRTLAQSYGLRVADKRDSYDVCFIPDGDTAGYLAERLPSRPGPVVDLDGRTLGEHAGVWRYTVGQRRGLNLGTHERRFVVDVDAADDTVVVGPRDALACRWAELDAPTWTTGAPPHGRVRVQVRAHGATVPGRVEVGDAGRVRLELDEPVHGLAIGQAAVVYDAGDVMCLGGGRVARADRPAGLPVR
ncbi:tRNA 2-thiouridine(34) synthase MnmA [Egicoccus halophilus]|uniref:tRNA-specific 2-thiouridylase MnmA n=1 Tax=Egicoccus halophilus TaxID=1670830 RepID=A0A8J3EXP5_9ACTN|nr:tRNA 2-thiouridine(34) synthase MnmA [Egicoccus halophilus]GGI06164.1 tRNA-specific 2-thiouridylase MnmA [Egicoccus halophilus]